MLMVCIGLMAFANPVSVQAGKKARRASDKQTSLSQAQVLKADDYRHYAEYFNRMEPENIVQAIPNADAWQWMEKNIPLFACPQDNFEEIWYFRWWSYRKGIRETPLGYAFNEFLVQRSYSDKYNIIACAIGHQLMEGRWLHTSQYMDDYLHIWYRGNDGKPMSKLGKFSSWTPYAVWERYLVNQDADWMLDMLPDLDADYEVWMQYHPWPEGLYGQRDVSDGMEESISGGRRVYNARPTINSYMYGNAVVLARMYDLQAARLQAAGQDAAKALERKALYEERAAKMRQSVQEYLWNDEQQFFETRQEQDRQLANVREAIGFIPWYFNLPEQGAGKPDYQAAWKQVTDPKGFLAPYGLTTAERRHPAFRTHGVGSCEWDGAVWPFATSQTMTAMANVLNDYSQNYVNDSVYFKLMELYVESQYKRGRPYVGEYLDETTGYWLKGDQERSYYYNHSTFADLMITGLMGLRPRTDNVLEVHPLIPEKNWDWFCLDNILYHGRIITILWDKDGSRFGRGAGFQLLVDGKKLVSSPRLEPLQAEMK